MYFSNEIGFGVQEKSKESSKSVRCSDYPRQHGGEFPTLGMKRWLGASRPAARCCGRCLAVGDAVYPGGGQARRCGVASRLGPPHRRSRPGYLARRGVGARTSLWPRATGVDAARMGP